MTFIPIWNKSSPGFQECLQTKKTQWLPKNLLYTSNLKKPLFCHTGQNQMNILISVPLVIIFLHYECLWLTHFILTRQCWTVLQISLTGREQTSAHISCVTWLGHEYFPSKKASFENHTRLTCDSCMAVCVFTCALAVCNVQKSGTQIMYLGPLPNVVYQVMILL